MEVIIVSTPEECDRELALCTARVVGLDTETSTRPQSNRVSLLQLAFQVDAGYKVLLIRLASIIRAHQAGLLPKSLRKFLHSSRIIKVGAGIRGDATGLRNSYGVELNGWIDVQQIALSIGLPHLSMNYIGELLLPDYEAKEFFYANWDAELSPRLVGYASMDAVYSLRIYLAMLSPQIVNAAASSTTTAEVPEDATTDIDDISKIKSPITTEGTITPIPFDPSIPLAGTSTTTIDPNSDTEIQYQFRQWLETILGTRLEVYDSYNKVIKAGRVVSFATHRCKSKIALKLITIMSDDGTIDVIPFHSSYSQPRGIVVMYGVECDYRFI